MSYVFVRSDCRPVRYVYCLSVRSSVTKLVKTYFRKKEPILMQNGTRDPQGKDIKWSTLGFRRSTVEITRGQSRSHKSPLGEISQNYLKRFNQTRQVPAHCVTTTRMSLFKGRQADRFTCASAYI